MVRVIVNRKRRLLAFELPAWTQIANVKAGKGFDLSLDMNIEVVRTGSGLVEVLQDLIEMSVE